MNEMKRAKKATLQPAVPLQPAPPPPKEEIKPPEVKQGVVPSQKPKEAEDAQAKYKQLVDHYTKEFNERNQPTTTKNEKTQLESLAKKEMEHLAKDPQLSKLLRDYMGATINGRFDDLEKKLGLLAELNDEDLAELGIHSSSSEEEEEEEAEETTSSTKKKSTKKQSTPPPDSEEEDEYRPTTKEKKGKAPEKAAAKRRRGGGPFGDDSDDEIDYSKSKTESNRQARYQTRPYHRPKAPIPDSYLASLF